MRVIMLNILCLLCEVLKSKWDVVKITIESIKLLVLL